MSNWILAWAALEERVDGREIELHSRPQDTVTWNRANVYIRGDARDAYRSCVASGCGKTIGEALVNAVNAMSEYQASYKLSLGKLMAIDHADKRRRKVGKHTALPPGQTVREG